MLSLLILPATLFATATFAKTGLSGCTSSDASSPAGASLIWYVPDTGEICSILDCGGGRAPPKTTVPGCAAYKGTASYEPSYLPGWGPGGKIAGITSGGDAGKNSAPVTSSSSDGSLVVQTTSPTITSSARLTTSGTANSVVQTGSTTSSGSSSTANAAPTAWIAKAGVIAGIGAVVAAL